MAEYTIDITSYCPNNCEYCSTNANINGKHLSIETIIKFLKDVTEKDQINISGGEPLSHPQFWDILQLCKNITPNVWVYTNALSQIRYNTSILEEVKIEANVCLVPGKNVYIPQNTNKVHLLQLIPQGRAKNIKTINVSLSGDNCENCNHKVLQANGEIVDAPCKKNYK